MTGRASRRAAREWDLPALPLVRVEDVDERLSAGAGRTALMQVLIDHDAPGISRCPRCGWAATTSRRDCPSRVIAKALLERRPLPSWLAHLACSVPGARVRDSTQTHGQHRAVEDAAPGLFTAPERVDPAREQRETSWGPRQEMRDGPATGSWRDTAAGPLSPHHNTEQERTR